MRLALRLAFALAAVVGLGLAGTASAAESGPISRTGQAGPYTVTLKVLPAESFTGPHAEMSWDGGAQPVQVGGPEQPNHHLVAFVTRDGKPIEDARVEIGYQQTSEGSTWHMLPVARMHVAGKSLATTHYGNNVELGPGSYRARVRVNDSDFAHFTFDISS